MWCDVIRQQQCILYNESMWISDSSFFLRQNLKKAIKENLLRNELFEINIICK